MTDNTNSVATWPEDLEPEKLEQIIAIIAKEGMVDIESVTPGATLESLSIASVDVVSILMAVEEDLGIYVPIDNELAAAKNLSEFIAKIASQGDGGSDAGSPAAI